MRDATAYTESKPLLVKLGVGKMNKVESNTTRRVFLDFQGNDKLLWRGKLKKQLEVVSPEVATESS